jgi:outer membrane protein assembly factor BamB
MLKTKNNPLIALVICCMATIGTPTTAEDWLQLQGNAQHSGDASHISLKDSPGLVAAVPLSDALLAAPVISAGKAFVVESSGVVFAIDTQTLQVAWKFETAGGSGNCNNVSAPAVSGKYLHVGTMAGHYYVLDCDTGAVVRDLNYAEPVFAAPVVGNDRVYFATLGAQVFGDN